MRRGATAFACRFGPPNARVTKGFWPVRIAGFEYQCTEVSEAVSEKRCVAARGSPAMSRVVACRTWGSVGWWDVQLGHRVRPVRARRSFTGCTTLLSNSGDGHAAGYHAVSCDADLVVAVRSPLNAILANWSLTAHIRVVLLDSFKQVVRMAIDTASPVFVLDETIDPAEVCSTCEHVTNSYIQPRYVVVLGSADDLHRELALFSAGADSYIVWQLENLPRILMRIERLLKRAARQTTQIPQRVINGPLAIDLLITRLPSKIGWCLYRGRSTAY